jgi:excisionase family DNA binding protein
MPQTPPFLEPLLDAKSVAAILGVHQNTVLKLTRSGNLPGFRLGRYWRFRRGDMANWVAEKLPDVRSTANQSAAEPNRGG